LEVSDRRLEIVIQLVNKSKCISLKLCSQLIVFQKSSEAESPTALVPIKTAVDQYARQWQQEVNSKSEIDNSSKIPDTPMV
jgi:hypothetical protein